MIGRFVNLFKKNDLDEQRSFQRKVHGLVSEIYPDRIFTIPNDPLTLEGEGSVYGLTNLRSNFLLSSQTDGDLRELIGLQFNSVLNGTEYFDRAELNFEAAIPKLMPQLMPVEFLQNVDLAHFEFGDNVLLGFVVDSEEAYSYVRDEELVRWKVDRETIRDLSLSNLRERSAGIEMTAVPGDNGIFVVNTMDGFDAVRIVDIGFQELVAEHLGSPFFVGVPNRDFLICWSKKGDTEFQQRMRSQISNDFDERPYPLSRNAFEVRSDGSIAIDLPPEPDPRSKFAENN